MTAEEKTQLEKLVEKYLKEDVYKGESCKEVPQRIKWRVASYVQFYTRPGVVICYASYY